MNPLDLSTRFSHKCLVEWNQKSVSVIEKAEWKAPVNVESPFSLFLLWVFQCFFVSVHAKLEALGMLGLGGVSQVCACEYEQGFCATTEMIQLDCIHVVLYIQ